MMHARRWKLSAAQRADLWRRWKAGQSLHAIGRALGKDHVVIQLLLARHGGIVPAARRRSRRVLTLAEREDISRGIASGCSMRVINGHEKRWDFKLRRIDCKPVLRRPLETTGLIRTWL
jgi:IS30 family transposase